MPLSDPIDKALHIAGAVVIVGGAAAAERMGYLSPGSTWAATALNAILWPAREALQRRAKGKPMFRGWSADNYAEAFPPGVVGAIIAAAST